MYADCVVTGDVADEVMDTSKDEDTDEEDENSDEGCRMSTNYDPDEMFDCPLSQLFYVAMNLKNLLNNNKGISVVWPPDSHDLSMEEATKSIPSRLFNFIAWMLGFSVEPVEESKVSISHSETCKVVSIAQDLVYIASKGKKFTHKSLALAMATRHITGSVKLVKILHGLGHCVSPATVYKHDSALALSCNNTDQNLIIPRNINPGSFSTIIWDNNDFNEETVSGKGTTHVANGIIVQKKSNDTPLLPKMEVSKTVRTIKPPETDILPYLLVKKGLPSLFSHKDELVLDNKSHLQHQSDGRIFDFAYILSKLDPAPNGVILPSWTAFNTKTNQTIPTQSTIGYLPVIDASMTDLATVNTILGRSVLICKELQLPQIVLVFDEAIYAKAQMIRWNHEEYLNKTVIRLGDFHTVMSYCTGISKIFKDAGLTVYNYII